MKRIIRPSLPSQATDVLRAELSHGTWTGTLPGERVLCERLGISRPTLRTALSALRNEGLLEIVHGKPTRITGLPRRSQLSSTRDVRLLSPVPLHEMPPFMVCWVDKLRERLSAAGHTMELMVQKKAFSGRPERTLSRLVASLPPATWILFLSHPAMQRWFAHQHVPCVLAGSVASGVSLPSVDLDYRAICRHAAGFLKSKGRKRLVLVLPDNDSPGDLESEAGFNEALADSTGIHAEIIRHEESPGDIQKKVRAALSAGVRADAFIVARSAHALTVLTCLLREGVRIPDDVALISRDDDAFLAHTTPTVARYRSDPDTWAKQMDRIVGSLSEGSPSKPQTIRLMPDFVRGQSAV